MNLSVMKNSLPQLLVFAVLATGASAQLHFDNKVYGPLPPAPLSFDSVTIRAPASSQWRTTESTFVPWTADWAVIRPAAAAAVAAFTIGEAGTSSTVAPMASVPPTFVFWDESATWTTVARRESRVPQGLMASGDMMHDEGFHWPRHESFGYEAISRLQPYYNVTVVPETSTLAGAGVLLAFVTVHFFRQRRNRRKRMCNRLC